ncbi:MAG: ergothioneine biosynthesis protein EgtB [Cyclobacteriaceae bacterium]|nr:ergothioneine biosynthesis protein EgtB [Cyclobacteriaceae bacterium]MCH8516647.1 ergothioneine biosynthesis protein EgtB [Cyclobacteriaceae bacterium]
MFNNTSQSVHYNLLSDYQQIRSVTEAICETVDMEEFAAQSASFVSPPKWHLGHTTWFFEMFVVQATMKHEPLYHDQYPYLFNSYYNSMGDRIQSESRHLITRPTVEEIYDYRKYIDEKVAFCISEGLLVESSLEALKIGLQHEQQHQELLLMDIKHIRHSALLSKKYDSKIFSEQHYLPQAIHYLQVQKGIYEIGAKPSENGFIYDNESGRHHQYLESFQIADRPVNEAEYLDFISDGGYSNPLIWLSEGWDWVKANHVKHPLYWSNDGDGYCVYTLSEGKRPISPNRAVMHISYYEAQAYANWAGKRLPSEFEWEIAASKIDKEVTEIDFLLGNDNRNQNESSSRSFFFGIGWEWTQSAYLPYPYYKAPPGALGEYNGKFMINQMVLRGGSFATPIDHIRTTYRNFFHPEKRWQFSCFRLADWI